MNDLATARHRMPFLAVAQANKEVTHNEALARIDALLHPVVEGTLGSPPLLATTDVGQSWLIAPGASGEWQGKDGQIAYSVGGSWRYIEPTETLRLKNVTTGADMIRIGDQWIAAPSVANPQSGTVVDVEARAAIMTLLSHFRTIGQVAP